MSFSRLKCYQFPFFFTVDASNSSSPPQASSTAETPLSPPSQVMTSSDKIKATPIHESGGSTQGNNPTNSQNSNSLAHHNNTTNIINNNHSQNTENYKNDALNKPGRYQEDENRLQPHLGTPSNNNALSKRSPSHESHFSGGSGVLSDAPPARSARRQYVSKSKSSFCWLDSFIYVNHHYIYNDRYLRLWNIITYTWIHLDNVLLSLILYLSIQTYIPEMKIKFL